MLHGPFGRRKYHIVRPLGPYNNDYVHLYTMYNTSKRLQYFSKECRQTRGEGLISIIVRLIYSVSQWPTNG